jgi:hypothetical protein
MENVKQMNLLLMYQPVQHAIVAQNLVHAHALHHQHLSVQNAHHAQHARNLIQANGC